MSIRPQPFALIALLAALIGWAQMALPWWGVLPVALGTIHLRPRRGIFG